MKHLFTATIAIAMSVSAHANETIKKYYLSEGQLDPQLGMIAKKGNNGLLVITEDKVKMEITYKCTDTRCIKVAVTPLRTELPIVQHRKGSCEDVIVAKSDKRPVDGKLEELTITDYSNSKCTNYVKHMIKAEYKTSRVDRSSGKTFSTNSVLYFDPALPKKEIAKIGIGNFQQNQILALNFLSHVGWDESTEYEETGLKMKDLLIKMVSQNKDAKLWIEKVNNYFKSEEFSRMSDTEKKQVVFEAKLYVKLTIKELGLVIYPI